MQEDTLTSRGNMPYSLNVPIPLSCDLRPPVPQAIHAGRVDHRELGFVHPVSPGDVVAEVLVPAGERFSPEVAQHLIGEGCALGDASTEHTEGQGVPVVATRSGHLDWDERALAVRDTLVVDEDVTYHVGNIRYFGDLIVRGMVRVAFRVRARSLLVEGLIEGAFIECERLEARGGVKAGGSGRLRVRETVSAPFMENAIVHAGSHVVVSGSSLHNEIKSNASVQVAERLIGGMTAARDSISVGERLGGGMSTLTRVQVGYDPFLNTAVHRLEVQAQHVEEVMLSCAKLAGRGGRLGDKAKARGERYAAALKRLRRKLADLLARLDATSPLETCTIDVRGEVRPGVEICIGPARLMNQDFLKNVRFSYCDGAVVATHPAGRTA